MTHPILVSIIETEIDINEIVSRISIPTTGASVVFSGIVRGITVRGKTAKTSYLIYEAYLPMAEEKMHRIASEIRKKWPFIEGVALIQRIGRLDVGETSTVIACTSSHRDNGIFDAVHYGIDRLKEIVPIWKKEIGPDGTFWVEGTYHPRPGE
jgi:molybdopterin synthase catalytic subunit